MYILYLTFEAKSCFIVPRHASRRSLPLLKQKYIAGTTSNQILSHAAKCITWRGMANREQATGG